MLVDRYDAGDAVAPPEPAFTGDVRIHGYFSREVPSRLRGAIVRFAPGARTPWKVNPAGQTLVVIEGSGLAQQEGGGIVELRGGDVVWCPPGVRHWDGAAPDRPMTCVALHEAEGGSGVRFEEAVDDETYAGSRRPRG